MTVQWEEPEPDRRGAPATTPWQDIADALRERPGQWALITESAPGALVSRVKNGAMLAFRPAGAFEATGRDTGEATRRYKVWARYVGENGKTS